VKTKIYNKNGTVDPKNKKKYYLPSFSNKKSETIDHHQEKRLSVP